MQEKLTQQKKAEKTINNSNTITFPFVETQPELTTIAR